MLTRILAAVRAGLTRDRGLTYSARATTTTPKDAIPPDRGDAKSAPTPDDLRKAGLL